MTRKRITIMLVITLAVLLTIAILEAATQSIINDFFPLITILAMITIAIEYVIVFKALKKEAKERELSEYDSEE